MDLTIVLATGNTHLIRGQNKPYILHPLLGRVDHGYVPAKNSYVLQPSRRAATHRDNTNRQNSPFEHQRRRDSTDIRILKGGSEERTG
jgi:hypothetical protein